MDKYHDLKNQLEELHEKDPITKIFAFRGNNKDFDCDVSEVAMKEAIKLYPYLDNADVVKQPIGEYNRFGYKYEIQLHSSSKILSNYTLRGDVSNSFWNIYKKAIKIFTPKNKFNQIFKELCREQKTEYIKVALERHCQNKRIPDLFLPNVINVLFERFASLNHTMPNIVLLPIGLNVGRSLRTADVWSILLYAIYVYFEEHNDIYLERIFYKDNHFEIARKWLNEFGNWTNFVELNKQEAYLDSQGVPLELFKGQIKNFEELMKKDDEVLKYNSIVEELLPNTEEEFIQYLTNVIRILETRYKGEKIGV